ncbi:MAG: 6-bladed beta-propeller [Bacteroidota bacterium]
MIFKRTSKIVLLFTVCLILFSSCIQDENQVPDLNTSEVPTLELDHQFTISDTEEVILQQITGVKSDSKGRIFLPDQRALQIHVFDSQGDYVTTIGREGSGPSELLSLLKIYIDQNDQIITFDVRQARNTIFAESNDSWEPEDMFMIEGQRYSVESADSLGNVILRQSPPQRPKPGAYWYEHELATGNLTSGLKEQNVLTFKVRGNLVSNNGAMQQIPFGRTTVVATDTKGNIYLVWNEKLELATYDATMQFIDSLSVPIPNQPISSEERSEAIEQLGDNFKSLGREHIPETKPVISNMFVDGNRNIWLQTFDSPEYLVLDHEGAPIGSFDLEDDLRLVHVDKNRLYALKLGPEGYQVHVYDYML